MDAIITISLFIAGTIIALIGYFLRTTYNDIKSDYNDIKLDVSELNGSFHIHNAEHGKLKGKLELLEQEHRLKYQLIQEVTQQEIKNMASQIGKLSDTVGELVSFQIKQNK